MILMNVLVLILYKKCQYLQALNNSLNQYIFQMTSDAAQACIKGPLQKQERSMDFSGTY